ncbi:hypothetical protein [Dyadobacter bucti]|uniref:hypothetical protein n=1 Tax=Dyadobacter bucti TaxID=2572203 RepID=UPI003F6EADFA
MPVTIAGATAVVVISEPVSVKTLSDGPMQTCSGNKGNADTQQHFGASSHGLYILWVLVKIISQVFFFLIRAVTLHVIVVTLMATPPSPVTAAAEEAKKQAYKKEKEKYFEQKERDGEKYESG